MANEVRLIDAVKYREMLEEEIAFSEENGKEELVHGLEIAVADLMDAPNIDPETMRPNGQWVSNWYKITCSSCNHSVFLGTKDPVCHKAEKENFKFCPNCGAKMEG